MERCTTVLQIPVEKELHRAVKVRAAQDGTTMANILLALARRTGFLAALYEYVHKTEAQDWATMKHEE